jgi:hypothetical protein
MTGRKSEIEKVIKRRGREMLTWQGFIADGESVGIRIEREGDLARQQEEQQQEMEMRW